MTQCNFGVVLTVLLININQTRAETDAPTEPHSTPQPTDVTPAPTPQATLSNSTVDATVAKLSVAEHLAEVWAMKLWGVLPTYIEALTVLVIGWIFVGCLSRCLKRRLLSLRIPRVGDQIELLGSDAESDDGDGSSSKFGEMDPTIVGFLTTAMNTGLKMMLCLSVASILGIKTTSFLAILTASSLAVGLALQGQLTNLASGVMLILFRSFGVGDHVTVADCTGVVAEVGLFTVVLESPDGFTHIVPNGKIGIITLHTKAR